MRCLLVITLSHLIFALADSSLSPPTWPDKWHAKISITGTHESSELAIRVVSSGHFVYDHDPVSGQVRASSSD